MLLKRCADVEFHPLHCMELEVDVYFKLLANKTKNVWLDKTGSKKESEFRK